jgi:hypothetical protein
VEVCPWLVAALYQCIFVALYVRKKCNLKTALFVAFNLVHAKNCIIRLSDANTELRKWTGLTTLTARTTRKTLLAEEETVTMTEMEAAVMVRARAM